MKKIMFLLILSLGFLVTAQEKDKNKEAQFKVNGTCKMCKKRIEKAAFSVKGVKSANWNIEQKEINLIIDETKCSLDDVKKAIANVGHDVVGLSAANDVYEKLHSCCKYRSE